MPLPGKYDCFLWKEKTMNDNDPVMLAVALRDDPLPEGPPPEGHKRASLCVDIRDEEDVARLEQWMLRNVSRLTCVKSTGCGCCVIGWEIEGPAAILDTLPPQLVTVFGWSRDYCNSGSQTVSRFRLFLRGCLRRARGCYRRDK